jgi:amino acid transporter
MIGTKESSTFNVVLTIVHVLLVVFIVIAGLVKSNPVNAQPFFPYEVRGVFNVSGGASGSDAVGVTVLDQVLAGVVKGSNRGYSARIAVQP